MGFGILIKRFVCSTGVLQNGEVSIRMIKWRSWKALQLNTWPEIFFIMHSTRSKILHGEIIASAQLLPNHYITPVTAVRGIKCWPALPGHLLMVIFSVLAFSKDLQD